MTDCFICKKNIRWGSEPYKAKVVNELRIDLPIGFTNSDQICKNCIKNLEKEQDRLRTQGNCFICKKILGVHDDKFFKEELHDCPENFTFCDLACEECVEKSDEKFWSRKNGPICSKCDTHVEGYGNVCSKCGIKVTYENQKREKSAGGWYVLSILLGIFGGLIGYVSLKNENPEGAKNCLIIGIIVSIIFPIIGIIFLGI
jgi:hypothetical protein